MLIRNNHRTKLPQPPAPMQHSSCRILSSNNTINRKPHGLQASYLFPFLLALAVAHALAEVTAAYDGHTNDEPIAFMKHGNRLAPIPQALRRQWSLRSIDEAWQLFNGLAHVAFHHWQSSGFRRTRVSLNVGKAYLAPTAQGLSLQSGPFVFSMESERAWIETQVSSERTGDGGVSSQRLLLLLRA